MICLLYIIISTRVRNMMGDYVFTGVCLLTWGVTPVSCPMSLPSLRSHLLSRAVPQPLSFLEVDSTPVPGATPVLAGGYHSPVQAGGGTSVPAGRVAQSWLTDTPVPGQDWGTPWARTWVPQARTGVPL